MLAGASTRGAPGSSTSTASASAWFRFTFVTRAHDVAREPAADEDDEAVQPRDAVPAVGERLDLEIELRSVRTGAAMRPA